MNCYNKDYAPMPSSPLKPAYDFDDFDMSDDNDDGMSDTTDSGSEVSVNICNNYYFFILRHVAFSDL